MRKFITVGLLTTGLVIGNHTIGFTQSNQPGLTHHNSESGVAAKPCLLDKSRAWIHIRNFSIVYWRIQCIAISII